MSGDRCRLETRELELERAQRRFDAIDPQHAGDFRDRFSPGTRDEPKADLVSMRIVAVPKLEAVRRGKIRIEQNVGIRCVVAAAEGVVVDVSICHELSGRSRRHRCSRRVNVLSATVCDSIDRPRMSSVRSYKRVVICAGAASRATTLANNPARLWSHSESAAARSSTSRTPRLVDDRHRLEQRR